MKESLAHLPQHKQDEAERIALQIREGIEPEMIILYGSYARGDYKEQKDLAPDRKSGHVSDYDILVVTGEKETADNAGLWNDVTRKCGKLNQSRAKTSIKLMIVSNILNNNLIDSLYC